MDQNIIKSIPDLSDIDIRNFASKLNLSLAADHENSKRSDLWEEYKIIWIIIGSAFGTCIIIFIFFVKYFKPNSQKVENVDLTQTVVSEVTDYISDQSVIIGDQLTPEILIEQNSFQGLEESRNSSNDEEITYMKFNEGIYW